MAEALVSEVLGQLASITTRLAVEELRRVKDADKNISSLRRKFKDIQAVLEDAERKQLDDAGARRWLDKLTDVSYDIDDVLDEWSTEALKSEIQKRVEAEENDHHQKVADKKKVCLPLTSYCFCVNQLKRVGVCRDIAHRIKELNETLEGIAKERQHHSLETTKVVQKQTRETISFVDESQVYGLDGPKSALIEKLLSESSEGRPGGEKEEGARMMGAAAQMITLQLLSDEFCWSIFIGLAFRDRDSEECKQLEGVGREIAKNSKGRFQG
ncbi:hypothetical protein FEM48_Zijuj03G0002600 [Ziziphus jujuba var. spinosa]|uniref:Disease resistance N-terminal domain-containing protein n=1 Tax=Ziziphus jujuba var. spinosa TaxID=714518 RepID=A0A978VM31_ZIZJJ|nr:hypothetical protein FEM48_Zijuj03G0002600 [Ziziphus jujuba var. spinosa]